MSTLLIRKDGYAHPWCTLSGKADNGCNPARRLADHILCYGEGSAYQTASPEMKKYHYVLYAITALMSILAIVSAIQVFRSDIGWEVEWNIFESPGLWGTFSFIGFFLQFFNWQHTSFEHATEVTFQDGSKKTIRAETSWIPWKGNFYGRCCHI